MTEKKELKARISEYVKGLSISKSFRKVTDWTRRLKEKIVFKLLKKALIGAGTAIIIFSGSVVFAGNETFIKPTSWEIDYNDVYDLYWHDRENHAGENRDCGYDALCDGRDYFPSNISIWEDYFLGDHKLSTHHAGIDYEKENGSRDVWASNYGVVVKIIENGNDDHGMGNTVIIHHNCVGGGYTGTIYTLYAHLRSYCVEVGQKVQRGQKIGEVGGTASGLTESEYFSDPTKGWPPHLHFEVKEWSTIEAPYCVGEAWTWKELEYVPKKYYGYTPSNPNNCGYHDPEDFIGNVLVNNPTVEESLEEPEVLTLEGPDGESEVININFEADDKVDSVSTSPDANVRRMKIRHRSGDWQEKTYTAYPGEPLEVSIIMNNRGNEVIDYYELFLFRSNDYSFNKDSDYSYGRIRTVHFIVSRFFSFLTFFRKFFQKI